MLNFFTYFFCTYHVELFFKIVLLILWIVWIDFIVQYPWILTCPSVVRILYVFTWHWIQFLIFCLECLHPSSLKRLIFLNVFLNCPCESQHQDYIGNNQIYFFFYSLEVFFKFGVINFLMAGRKHHWAKLVICLLYRKT